VHNEFFYANVVRLLDEKGMSQSDLAAQAGLSLALLSEVAHGRVSPSHTLLRAIAQILGMPLPTLLETICLDGAALEAFGTGRVIGTLPPGFVRISVLLTEQQALCVGQWDEDNRKICTTKVLGTADIPLDRQHRLDD